MINEMRLYGPKTLQYVNEKQMEFWGFDRPPGYDIKQSTFRYKMYLHVGKVFNNYSMVCEECERDHPDDCYDCWVTEEKYFRIGV